MAGREFKSTIMRRWQDDKKNFMEVDGGEGWLSKFSMSIINAGC